MIQDIDIYGRENASGAPIEYFDNDAVKIALTMWLITNKGEYLMDPTEGGILKKFNFKNLDDNSLKLMRFNLIDTLSKEFTPAIRLQSVNIVPDYENKLLSIEIYYKDPITNKEEAVIVYTKDTTQRETFSYEDVTYVAENLRNWCLVKKPDLGNRKLIFNYDQNAWTWGQYRLINLTQTDPYFDTILTICNVQ